MRVLTGLLIGTSVLATALVLGHHAYAADVPADRLVRIAELSIDPAQLVAYKLALKEEITSSIRLEPGVLALYAVSVKGHPEQIRLLEIYRGEAAYKAHLQSAHFKKYKEATKAMVMSLKLTDTEPILLGSK